MKDYRKERSLTCSRLSPEGVRRRATTEKGPSVAREGFGEEDTQSAERAKEEGLGQKTLLSPRRASSLFGIPLRTVYVWYQLGKIDGVNMNGKSLRIFSKSLIEFLESRTRRAAKPKKSIG